MAFSYSMSRFGRRSGVAQAFVFYVLFNYVLKVMSYRWSFLPREVLLKCLFCVSINVLLIFLSARIREPEYSGEAVLCLISVVVIKMSSFFVRGLHPWSLPLQFNHRLIVLPFKGKDKRMGTINPTLPFF